MQTRIHYTEDGEYSPRLAAAVTTSGHVYISDVPIETHNHKGLKIAKSRARNELQILWCTTEDEFITDMKSKLKRME